MAPMLPGAVKGHESVSHTLACLACKVTLTVTEKVHTYICCTETLSLQTYTLEPV